MKKRFAFATVGSLQGAAVKGFKKRIFTYRITKQRNFR